MAPEQSAYVPGRFIGEPIRLISDILKYTDKMNIPCYMFAADNTFSKQAGQFLVKTPNFDKQAEKFLITPVDKLEKY